MFSKTVFAFALALLVVVRSNPLSGSTAPQQLVSIIELEESCVQQGGLCMRIEDCDPSNLVQVRGVLCPTQQHLGVECCYV